MAIIHSVSCSEEDERLLKELGISPSDAFKQGIRLIANKEPDIDPLLVETFKTEKNLVMQLQRANRQMEEQLQEVNDVLEKERGNHDNKKGLV